MICLCHSVFLILIFKFWTWQLSLVALSFWSFHFASICAFGLLAYVGYIVYAFPSLFRLHRLNSLLLVFILLWAISTYVFNVAFSIVNWKLAKVIFFILDSVFSCGCIHVRPYIFPTRSITDKVQRKAQSNLNFAMIPLKLLGYRSPYWL